MKREFRFTRSAAAIRSGQRSAARLEDVAGEIVEGYAAIYYKPGDAGTEYCLWDEPGTRCVERLMPGCFDDVLSQGPDCRFLFNHNSDLILARTSNNTLKLTTDKTGMRYMAQLNDTHIAWDVARHVERGDVTGSSFCFGIAPDGETWRNERLPDGSTLTIREVRKVAELPDVSCVTFPAYKAASAGMRIDSTDAESITRPPTQDAGLAAHLAAYTRRADQVRGEVLRENLARLRRRADQVVAEAKSIRSYE